MKTQVAVIGAGPAGLRLAELLQRQGVDSVVVERHSRARVLGRIRAGVREPTTVEVLRKNDRSARVDRVGQHPDLHVVEMSEG
jgi:p-hydroxybenzoate 3-monooxygenase